MASSSHGNAYIVSDCRTRILLECGLAFRTLQKKCGFSLCEFDAVLVTHEHKDHARCAGELARIGQSVYMSAGTALALGLAEERPLSAVTASGEAVNIDPETAVSVISAPNVMMVEHREQFSVGSFDIVPFNTYHDAAEPLGYLIRSRADGDVLVFATDTVNLRYRFPGLRFLAIEANYQESILSKAIRIPDKTKDRIRNTHMEIDTLCEILCNMDLSKCREICLLHLSDAMSHEGQFINKVKRCVPPWVTVRAAER